MQMVDFFYGIFWTSTISIIWFCTDWLIHYLQLFHVYERLTLRYKSFVFDNKYGYFPDFLYEISLQTNNTLLKFVFKLLSCPFCLNFWLSLFVAIYYNNISATAVFYVSSLFILFQIKKLI